MPGALASAQSEQNMSARDLRRFKKTDQFAEWRRRRDRDRYRGYAETVVGRAIDVANGTATTNQAQKVNSYLSRAKAAFREDGAGQTKLAGASKNVVALRAWGYDPYSRY